MPAPSLADHSRRHFRDNLQDRLLVLQIGVNIEVLIELDVNGLGAAANCDIVSNCRDTDRDGSTTKYLYFPQT